MNFFIFGNSDLAADNTAIKIANKLKRDFPKIKFVFIKPNEDLPITDKKRLYLIDVVSGIKDITIFENKDFNKLSADFRSTVHDFDLGFQLKYLSKLKKIGQVIIIGIPQNKNINYSRFKSIFKKLVAQDMQGS